MLDSPSLATLIREAIESHMLDVHTALPCRIETFDATTQRANVKPEVKRVVRQADGTRVAESLPVIPDVPVMFFSGGGFFISLPLQPGDTGMLVFCESSIDAWRSQNQDVDPADARRHGLSGAVFVPGLRVRNDSLGTTETDKLAIARLGSSAGLDVSNTGVRIGRIFASEGIGLGDTIKSHFDALKTWLDAHVHVETGGTTNAAIPSSPTVPTCASANNKVAP